MREYKLKSAIQEQNKENGYDERLISPEAAARLLGVTRTCYYGWIKKGKINPRKVCIGSQVVRVFLSDIIAIMEISEEEKQALRTVNLTKVPSVMGIQKAADIMGVSMSVVYELTCEIEDRRKKKARGGRTIDEAQFIPTIKSVNGKARIERKALYAFINSRIVNA